MAPPELARDAPVLDVVHPLVVGVDPLLGEELDLAGFDDADRFAGDRFAVAPRLGHRDEPLVGEHRLDDLASALAAWHGETMLACCFQQALRLQVGDDLLACDEAVEAAIGRRRVVVERGVEVQHAEHRQTVALADRIVVGVVCRRDLDNAGAELAVDIGIGDHRDLAARERQLHARTNELGVAFVVGMHHQRDVAEHRLGPRGGHGQMAGAADQWIADQPQRAVFLLRHHFEVGHCRLQHRIPVDQALAAIDQAFVVQPHEGFIDHRRQFVVHREVLVRPADAVAHAAHLARDGGARAVLPVPHLGDEILAPEIMARQAGILQLALDHDLRGDARVVGAGQPQRVEAAHAVVARQRIHDGLVERVAHVQRAGHVGRWQLDRERWLGRIERRRVDPALLPQWRPPRLDGGGFERLGEGFCHAE